MTFEPPPSVSERLARMDPDKAAAARDGVPFCDRHRVRQEWDEAAQAFLCPRCFADEEEAAAAERPDGLFALTVDPHSGRTNYLYDDPRDAEAGRRQREEAIARVTSAAPDDWTEAAYAALVAIAKISRLSGPEQTLTTDAVWVRLTALGVEPPPERRAMAAVIRRAEREGLIEKTERFVPSDLPWAHRRNTQVWRIL